MANNIIVDTNHLILLQAIIKIMFNYLIYGYSQTCHKRPLNG